MFLFVKILSIFVKFVSSFSVIEHNFCAIPWKWGFSLSNYGNYRILRFLVTDFNYKTEKNLVSKSFQILLWFLYKTEKVNHADPYSLLLNT